MHVGVGHSPLEPRRIGPGIHFATPFDPLVLADLDLQIGNLHIALLSRIRCIYHGGRTSLEGFPTQYTPRMARSLRPAGAELFRSWRCPRRTPHSSPRP